MRNTIGRGACMFVYALMIFNVRLLDPVGFGERAVGWFGATAQVIGLGM